MNGKDEQPARPFLFRRRVLTCCDALMVFAAASAIAALALEYGFYQPPVALDYLHIVQACVLGAFVLDRFAHLLLARDRRAFFGENWIDFAAMLAAAVAAVVVAIVTGQVQARLLSGAAVYVVITQVYILAVLVIRTVGFQFRVAGAGIHPIWVLIGSFIMVILFGTGLLMLPRAVPQDNSLMFTDALFTATSATCVTGLIVRDTGTEFAHFGQVVILAMIQLGGLGIMVFGTVFALLAGRGLSIRESLVAGQVLANGTIGRMGRMVKFAVLTALGIEAVAAAVMYPMWRAFDPGAGAVQTVYRSTFHAVSAFCNSGFSLQHDSLESLRRHWQVIGVMAPLIFLGGLGFPVLYDLVGALWRRLVRWTGRGRSAAGQILTLHSKIVLTTSVVLLVGGAAGLFLIERASGSGQAYGAPIRDKYDPHPLPEKNTLAQLDDDKQVREAVFQSVTARTAGFNTVDMDRLSKGGKLWMCLLMIIGGSPASTAGGMKTVTLAVLVLTIWCMFRRRERVEGFRRSITEPFIRKAVTLAGLYLTLVLTVTLLLCVAMSGKGSTFMQIFFEACSACGTVGLTCGVTESLTSMGKYVIIAAMFIGRLGPLTLLLALTVRLKPVRYAYPSEEVVLG